MSENKTSTIYRISFMMNESVCELYAKHVAESGMFGFMEVEEILFGESSAIVVDPSEERLRAEFSGVKRTYIPYNDIVRIDEVEKLGTSKMRSADQTENNKITHLAQRLGGAGRHHVPKKSGD